MVLRVKASPIRFPTNIRANIRAADICKQPDTVGDCNRQRYSLFPQLMAGIARGIPKNTVAL